MDAKQLHCLYVEDDALSRQVMQMIMENAIGVRDLVMFEDSRDFMARLRALPARPDVILMDIHMQPEDGFAMLAMLRSDRDFAHTIVIALTASVMSEEVERLRAGGFDGAISKPVSVTIFPGLIAKVAEGESVWHIG